MRLVLVAIMCAACGGGSGGGLDAADGRDPDGAGGCGDCDAPSPPDAAAACAGLDYGARDVTAIELFEDGGRLHAGRSFRVAISYDATPCDELAMPTATIATATHRVRLDPHVFAPRAACPGLPIRRTRVLTLRLDAGTWRLTGAATGTPPTLDVTVGPAPLLPCAPGPGGCLQDCDCVDGERCLGGVGFGGPFLQCAAPCELDRDCGGGQCVSIVDGLQLTCDRSLDECGGPGQSCPVGFSCALGACAPDFTLSASTRHDCACDADCAAPLRCVTAAGPGPRSRCEIPCPTGGAWCAGAHACGPASADLSGLAASDSVCGWLGD